MKPIVKTVGALGLAGALALSATTTPSFADDRWAYAAGGFALGTFLGAAATANTRAYYGSPYYYDSYAYDPGYTYVAPSYGYAPAPAYTYSYPAYGYDSYAYSPAPVYVAPAPRHRWGAPNSQYNRFDHARGNIGG
jgi:hypothetical protein